MNAASILVVEDESIVAANIEMRLQSLGYRVPAVVDSSHEALEMISAKRPDLVLMDIRITGQFDGITTAEMIRTRFAIPVIYLTAYTDDETLQRARHTEPYGYLLKPFDVNELRTAIELALYRHMVERQRRAADERLRLIESAVQQAEEMLLILKGGSARIPRVVFANRSFVRITGFSQDEISRGGVESLFEHAGSTTSPADLEGLFAAGRIFRGEGLLYRKDAVPFVAEWSLTPLFGPRGALTHWVAVFRDVTRIRREEEVRIQRQKLESLGVLAGGIAHDFNNLLAVILGNASMAMIELPADSPVRELIGPIELAARRAAELTRQMLAYAGHNRLSSQTLDLNTVIQEVCASMASQIPPSVELRAQYAAALPTMIADVTQLRRLMRNLIINAYEAIGDAPGVIEITTALRQVSLEYIATTYLSPNLPAGEYIAITVADSGAGIAPEVRPRLFEPFFSTKFAGRGLGLPEVLGIVSAHQGTIQIESAVGRGTTVTVLVPASIYPEKPPPEAAGAEGAEPGLRRLILIVDDSPEMAAQTAQAMEKINLAPLKALDGPTGRDLFQAYADMIDCVLLDANLPDGESWRVLAAVRQAASSTPVLLLSDRERPLDIELAAAVSQVVRSPCTPQELQALVEAALAH
jgi:two-component system, cell cycle sensor histidine kinase and response regulator CckA